MKNQTLVFIGVISTCFVSAGIVPELEINGMVYPAGSEILLSPGIHLFSLYTDGDPYFPPASILTLCPIDAAHFVTDWIVVPMGYTYEFDHVLPPPWDNCDVLLITPDTVVSPSPYQPLHMTVDFMGPEAIYAIWDDSMAMIMSSWTLIIPEPATLFLLALGAFLAGKKRRVV